MKNKRSKLDVKWKSYEQLKSGELLGTSCIFSQPLRMESSKLGSKTVFISPFDWQSRIFEKNYPCISAQVPTRNCMFFCLIFFQYLFFFSSTEKIVSPIFVPPIEFDKGYRLVIFLFFPLGFEYGRTDLMKYLNNFFRCFLDYYHRPSLLSMFSDFF